MLMADVPADNENITRLISLGFDLIIFGNFLVFNYLSFLSEQSFQDNSVLDL